MGQTKETHFARIMAKNTIDERLVQIQRDKLQMVAKTVTEHDSSASSISAEELASLFGRVMRDADGNVVGIEADYRDEGEEEGEETETEDEEEEEEGAEVGGAGEGDESGEGGKSGEGGEGSSE